MTLFFLRKQFYTSQVNSHQTYTKSSIHSIFQTLFNKIFFDIKSDKSLNECLQFTIIRANLFYLHSWLIVNDIRKGSSNLKVRYYLNTAFY